MASAGNAPSLSESQGLYLAGGNVSRDAGPVKGGTTEIAFVKDPTGYSWEIIQRKDQKIREPIAQACSRLDQGLGFASSLGHVNLE